MSENRVNPNNQLASDLNMLNSSIAIMCILAVVFWYIACCSAYDQIATMKRTQTEHEQQISELKQLVILQIERIDALDPDAEAKDQPSSEPGQLVTYGIR